MKLSLILRILSGMVSLSCLAWGLLQSTQWPVMDQRIGQLDGRVDEIARAFESHREADTVNRIGIESRISKIEARLDIMLYLLVGIALAAGTTLVDTGFRIATSVKRRNGGS